MKTRILAMLLGLMSMGPSFAAPVVPIAYDMSNGTAATFSFWDDLYSGSGCRTCSGALLSGGLGDLSNGVAATSSWNVTPAPYVGWSDFNPTIAYHFGQTVTINSVTFSVDNPGSGLFGPSSVVIGAQTFPVTLPSTSGPFQFTVSGLGFVGSDLNLTINRTGGWLFVSEISFASAVPELGMGELLAAGLALILGVTARARRSPAALAN